ncbi:hypothetical protein BDV25DRAFT_144114 [Aspergillus avenaceus]|uniref:P-loop containing nucleoside triphosphate hydrolase protein n=1 Tax=Aspergillus avenaceus TaxID=36643 RepID=A0A5N6TI32_ASPAV|nr:hypothetical protein BDV25DRAFT_144114 [Aspergillus avenaceus]
MPTSIIGISGPSSSGKTTLARLLQRIFNDADPSLRTFMIHEDDFYFPDDKIPYTKTPSGELIQDWDTIGAIDVSFLTSALAYVREHGRLPPRLTSIQDRNETSESGVSDEIVDQLRGDVAGRLRALSQGAGTVSSVAFLEGFLLYSPPLEEEGGRRDESHVLRSVHEKIDVRMFLPAPYDAVKARRENRSGYATSGPAPGVSEEVCRGEKGEEGGGEVDLEGEDDRPLQNFWTDPPGYVDDVVWPRYVQDHSWLLLTEGQSLRCGALEADSREWIRKVGQGVNVRTDAGVTVAPGQGNKPMVDILKWAVEEVMSYLETHAT